MRFAILGISHETNTFSRVPTDYAQFEASDILRGTGAGATASATRCTRSPATCRRPSELGFEAVPLMWAQTGPLATITTDAYDRLTDEMFGMLRDQGPWDGVLIANHGAAVSEEHPDMDGAFARGASGPSSARTCRSAGRSTCTATSRERLVEVADITMVWRTNPHLDAKPRSRKCAELMFRTAKGEIRPVQWIETPPLVVNIVRQFTGEEPMKTLVADCIAANERPGILDTSVAEGYPYADVAQMGMAWVAIADGDLDAARRMPPAGWPAGRGASARRSTRPSRRSREALDMAVAAVSRSARRWATSTRCRRTGRRSRPRPPATADGLAPRLRADRADGRRRQHRRRVVGGLDEHPGRGAAPRHRLAAPDAVRPARRSQACVAAGVGAEVTLAVGAKTDDLHGTPVTVTGHGPDHRRRPLGGPGRHPRRLPLLRRRDRRSRLDTTDGHTLLLTSSRGGQHLALPDVQRGHPARDVPDRGRQGRRLAAARLPADRRRGHPGQHARRHDRRPVDLHVPSPAACRCTRSSPGRPGSRDHALAGAARTREGGRRPDDRAGRRGRARRCHRRPGERGRCSFRIDAAIRDLAGRAVVNASIPGPTVRRVRSRCWSRPWHAPAGSGHPLQHAESDVAWWRVTPPTPASP